MASCYGGSPTTGECDGNLGAAKTGHLLPIQHTVSACKIRGMADSEPIDFEVDYFRTQGEREVAKELLNEEIRLGQSWPFEEEFPDYESFAGYFMSHSAFVLRVRDFARKSQVLREALPHGVAGCFYIKPNFPGRCADVCNSGFIVRDNLRGNGLGKVLAKAFLPLARALEYRGSLFNLVFVSNQASNRLWRSLGFTCIGTIPKVGRLKGFDEFIDANQYYYDLTTLDEQPKNI